LVIVNSESGQIEPLIASTTLTVSGPQQQIQSLTTNDFEATVDLSGIGPGVHSVPIDVAKPQFVRVREEEPSELTIRVARELVKTVPITVTQAGRPPFSFTIGAMTQGAQETSARGPEDLVNQVVAAVAEVSLQGHTSDIAATYPLTPVDAAGNIVDGVVLSPERVSVQVPIIAQVEVQQVSVVPNLRGQPAEGYAVSSIDWDPKIIEVFTPEVITGTLRTEAISLTGLTDSITRTVGLEPQSNVITRPPLVQITVSVSIAPIGVPSQIPMFVPVSPIGISDDLTATADPSVVQVTVAGPFDRLNALAAEDLEATVDLGGLGPGSFSLPVRIDVPSGLTIVAPADPRVSVTIRQVSTPTPGPTPPASAVPSPTPTP
jgi:YbbR domain-containing protein